MIQPIDASKTVGARYHESHRAALFDSEILAAEEGSNQSPLSVGHRYGNTESAGTRLYPLCFDTWHRKAQNGLQEDAVPFQSRNRPALQTSKVVSKIVLGQPV